MKCNCEKPVKGVCHKVTRRFFNFQCKNVVGTNSEGKDVICDGTTLVRKYDLDGVTGMICRSEHKTTDKYRQVYGPGRSRCDCGAYLYPQKG